MYDLGEKIELDYIRYVGYSPTVDQRQSKFKIFVSKDNAQWTSIADRSTNTIPQPVDGFSFAVAVQ